MRELQQLEEEEPQETIQPGSQEDNQQVDKSQQMSKLTAPGVYTK